MVRRIAQIEDVNFLSMISGHSSNRGQSTDMVQFWVIMLGFSPARPLGVNPACYCQLKLQLCKTPLQYSQYSLLSCSMEFVSQWAGFRHPACAAVGQLMVCCYSYELFNRWGLGLPSPLFCQSLPLEVVTEGVPSNPAARIDLCQCFYNASTGVHMFVHVVCIYCMESHAVTLWLCDDAVVCACVVMPYIFKYVHTSTQKLQHQRNMQGYVTLPEVVDPPVYEHG